jgi:hypothetical protein
MKERDHTEDIEVDDRIILKREIELEGVHWVHCARDRDQWLALVKRVKYILVS